MTVGINTSFALSINTDRHTARITSERHMMLAIIFHFLSKKGNGRGNGTGKLIDDPTHRRPQLRGDDVPEIVYDYLPILTNNNNTLC